MKLLVDSSSSLLLSLLLAQLSLFTSAHPVNHRRLQELDKLTNQTRNLMKVTNDLLKEHFSDLEHLEHHRFKSLPVMNHRASDVHSLELKPTLSLLHHDLTMFEKHFLWLNNASRRHHHPALPKLTEMMSLIKALNTTLQRQMGRVDAPKLTLVTPSLPPQLHNQFEVLQSSHELLQQFERFCSWAHRALISLRHNPR
ncbi:uncharacterized protein il11a [Osmerus eperlanus]|uniref:uncharacterized protein il11a n=1 Tax=Osmerus eperlanus TaxID=29151 RepID=UPI002E0F8033